MITKHRFITAVAVTGALAGASATPALAAKKAPKVTDSAAVLQVAIVGAQSIKAGNYAKFCQLATPTIRRTLSYAGAICTRSAAQWVGGPDYGASWATRLLTYFNAASTQVDMTKGSTIKVGQSVLGIVHDAKMLFTLTYSGVTHNEVWAFKKMIGRQACYQGKTPCWRIAGLLHGTQVS
jgi:hypothetical protein